MTYEQVPSLCDMDIDVSKQWIMSNKEIVGGYVCSSCKLAWIPESPVKARAEHIFGGVFSIMDASQLWIYLDDEREMPLNFNTKCRWPEEVIEHLKTGKVAVLSLDHDLGEGPECDKPRTGMDVLKWLEEQVFTGQWKYPLPRIYIYSQNPVGRENM